MGLSYKDAAFFLAILESHIGDRAVVEAIVREAKRQDIGGKRSKGGWERMLELLRESKPPKKEQPQPPKEEASAV